MIGNVTDSGVCVITAWVQGTWVRSTIINYRLSPLIMLLTYLPGKAVLKTAHACGRWVLPNRLVRSLFRFTSVDPSGTAMAVVDPRLIKALLNWTNCLIANLVRGVCPN